MQSPSHHAWHPGRGNWQLGLSPLPAPGVNMRVSPTLPGLHFPHPRNGMSDQMIFKTSVILMERLTCPGLPGTRWICIHRRLPDSGTWNPALELSLAAGARLACKRARKVREFNVLGAARKQ